MSTAAEELIQSLATPPESPDVLGSMLAAIESPAPAPAAAVTKVEAPAVVETAPAVETAPLKVEDLIPGTDTMSSATSETLPLDDIPEAPPGVSSEKAKLDWKGLREAAKTAKARAAELEEKNKAYEAEIGEHRVRSAKLIELEEKAKGFDEAQKELAISRVEGTADYKRAITQPFEAIEGSLDAIAKANSLDLDKIFAAVLERDPAKRREAIEEVVSGLSVTDQHEILQASKDAQVLLTKRDQIRADAAAAKAELESRNSEKQTKAEQEAKEKYVDSIKKTKDTFVQKIPFVKVKEGETAEGIFGVIEEKATAADLSDPRMKAYSAMSGFLVPRLVEQMRYLQTQIEERDTRLAEFSAAKPSLGGAGVPAVQPAEDFLAAWDKRTIGGR